MLHLNVVVLVDDPQTASQVRDKGGAVFGGYAAEAWSKRGRFYGSAASFVFRLLPDFRVHFSSGANTNFQWAAKGFKELPNGVGFGGQMGYFALLVDETLDGGMSRPAATFGAPCLASTEMFAIDAVECWRVGSEEGDDGSVGGPGGTAMERFEADKVLLEVRAQIARVLEARREMLGSEHLQVVKAR
jgi:TLD